MATFPHDGAAKVWRDYIQDGVSTSGKWRPRKSEIRALVGYIETLVDASGIGISANDLPNLADFHVQSNGFANKFVSWNFNTANAPTTTGGGAVFLGRSSNRGTWLAAVAGGTNNDSRLMIKSTSGVTDAWDWGDWFELLTTNRNQTITGVKTFTTRQQFNGNVQLGGGGNATEGAIDAPNYIDINPRAAPGVRIGRQTGSVPELRLVAAGTTGSRVILDVANGYGRVQVSDGDTDTPVFSFINETNTGLIRNFAGTMGFISAGTLAATLGPGGTATGATHRVITREKGDNRYALASSSRRYKDAIQSEAARDLSSLQVRTWRWGGELSEDDPKRGHRGLGFIAEELLELLPEALLYDEFGRVEGIQPNALLGAIFAYFQTQIEDQRRQIQRLQDYVEGQRS